ncbi:MAG: triose-phosphate isomerase [Burkholderiaceae bacterium]
MNRKPMVAGNWKMNGRIEANEQLLEAMADSLSQIGGAVDIAICPPFPYIAQVRGALSAPTRKQVSYGAQNASEHEAGAFTGEVSAEMLVDLGCQWVILGHSERRTLFGETDAVVAAKADHALAAGLSVMICVGESLEQRESNQAEATVGAQIDAVLAALNHAEPARVVVAYEPIWAIGTGKTATPEMAQEIHQFIRSHMVAQGVSNADQIRILYGGSVKGANAKSLFEQADIDGGLIGGASLQSEDFIKICQAAA